MVCAAGRRHGPTARPDRHGRLWRPAGPVLASAVLASAVLASPVLDTTVLDTTALASAAVLAGAAALPAELRWAWPGRGWPNLASPERIGRAPAGPAAPSWGDDLPGSPRSGGARPAGKARPDAAPTAQRSGRASLAAPVLATTVLATTVLAATVVAAPAVAAPGPAAWSARQTAVPRACSGLFPSGCPRPCHRIQAPCRDVSLAVPCCVSC
jgi:hypothetical protein